MAKDSSKALGGSTPNFNYLVYGTKVLGKEFSIKELSNDSKDWLVVVDDAYRPDKQKFTVLEFKKDFPHIKLPDGNEYERITILASRSSAINEWIGLNNLKYATIENTPTFFRDYVTPEEYELTAKDTIKLNKIARERADEELKASLEYKTRMKQIRLKYDYEAAQVTSNPIVKILNLTTQVLPITLQNAIENYTPATNAPDKKAYAREVLIRFQIGLIQFIKNNPDVNLDDVLNELAVK